MAASGKSFILFARSQPDTPGKLCGARLLLRASRARGLPAPGDRGGTRRRHRDDGDGQRHRRGGASDGRAPRGVLRRGCRHSLARIDPGDIGIRARLVPGDAHALEEQAIAPARTRRRQGRRSDVRRGVRAPPRGDPREHAKMLERRLDAHDGSPSAIKDAAMRLGGLNWSAFFQAHPDTPGKLAAFAYAFEHLEIAGYELLARVAARAGDEHTQSACIDILPKSARLPGRSPRRSSARRTHHSPRQRRRGYDVLKRVRAPMGHAGRGAAGRGYATALQGRHRP